jgi:ribosomal protein L13
MKWILIPVLLMLTGCAVTVVNTASVIATGKSATDHVLTQATGADCNTANLANGLYYCERKDIGTTYNRTPF